ncbi:MAG: ATP-binding cassette domain-containing protein [Betaproteobacteria bacterium]|nr:ATP-binding cassette domain-containing protein [Betaproteobacteria bacterium]
MSGNEHDDCVIDVRNVWTQFGTHVVHRDLNLCVRQGEVMSLVGGSGSGKSTLLREILGLEQPTRGEIRVLGVSLQHGVAEEIQALRNRWGMLFQEGAMFSALSVFENVALPLREMKTLDEDLIHDLVMLKLKMVDIEPRHASKMPSSLSGGMVKRVALARALSLEPELLFLDEPTAGLDPERSESFCKLIAYLKRELELTVVMVTHDLDTIVSISDRVAVLADQKIAALGTVAEVAQHPHPFIVEYFQGERGRRALTGLTA